MLSRNGIETRVAVELRVASPSTLAAGGKSAGPGQLLGLAAPYLTPARIGGFTETILPGAFAACLAAHTDVRCLVDHDDSRLLGRTRSGTLRLFEHRNGLAYEIDLPDTQLGRDVHALALRGDLSGVSFGFTVPRDGDSWPSANTRELRTVDLAEVSILHRLPAYDATTIAARARQLGRAEADARVRAMVLASL